MDEKINIREMLQELYKHTENRMKEIEERVYCQFQEEADSYVIYSTITDRNNYDLTDSFLFPFCSYDLKERVFNFTEIKNAILKNGKYEICKVYFECDRPTITLLQNEKICFTGCIVTNRREYEAQFLIKEDLSYWDKISELKDTFFYNKVQWVPVNTPYLNKFFTVWITYCNDIIPNNEDIKKIVIDFALYDKFVKYNKIPLWNICKRFVKTEGFVYPLEDERVYEHHIRCEGICLVNHKEHEFLDIRKRDREVYITCNNDNSIKWDITEIKKYQKNNDKYYPVISNGIKQTFLSGYAKNLPYPIYTKEEISRIIHSFTAADNIILQDFYFEKDVVKFLFQQVRKDYMTLDIINFLMENMQLYMPHYKCEGELI